mgnify:CR=1 FL=1
MFGIDIEVVKVLGTILAGLLGGGAAGYFLIPGMLRKYRAETRKADQDALSQALENMDTLSKKVTDLTIQNESILSSLSGDFEMTTEFNMVQLIKNGEAVVSGRIRKVIEPASAVN